MFELDNRKFTRLDRYLVAWCADQPERSTNDKVAELARYAGCSTTQMYGLLDGERRPRRSYVPGLIEGLKLVGEQAEHLRDMVEAELATPRRALPLRKKVWRASAAALGLPWDETLFDDLPPSELTVAALGPALAALGDEGPAPATLHRRAVFPLTAAEVQAALPGALEWNTAAPRLVTLPDAEQGDKAIQVWQGALGQARAALPRLPKGQRLYRALVASVDEEAFQALQALSRGFGMALRALAEAWEPRPAERVELVLVELLQLTPVIRAEEGGRLWRWRKPPSTLPSADPADTEPSTKEAATPAQEAAGAARTRASVGSAKGEPMPRPTGHTHFPTYLKKWRGWRARSGLEHSDGFLARQTKLSDSTISDLARGVVRFGPQHVAPFVRVLGMEDDPEGQSALDGMVELAEKDQHWRDRARIFSALRGAGLERGVREPETEAHVAVANWYVPAVHQLALMKSFQGVPFWVVRALQGRVTLEAAADALEALRTLGLLRERTDGHLETDVPVAEISGPHPNLALRQFHDGAMRQLQSELSMLHPGLHLQGQALALPEKALPHLERELERFRAGVMAVLEQAEARRQGGQSLDRVVLLAWQRFPVFRFPYKPRRRRTPGKAPRSSPA